MTRIISLFQFDCLGGRHELFLFSCCGFWWIIRIIYVFQLLTRVDEASSYFPSISKVPPRSVSLNNPGCTVIVAFICCWFIFIHFLSLLIKYFMQQLDVYLPHQTARGFCRNFSCCCGIDRNPELIGVPLNLYSNWEFAWMMGLSLVAQSTLWWTQLLF